MTEKNGITNPTAKPKRTPEELQFLSFMERLEGRPLTEQEANLAIAQAELMGEL